MNLTDEQVAHEVSCINNEEIWPLWPILPMKLLGRSGGDGGVGIVWSGDKTVVHLLTMFDLKQNVPLAEQFAKYESIRFESVEAMVRMGWVGD